MAKTNAAKVTTILGTSTAVESKATFTVTMERGGLTGVRLTSKAIGSRLVLLDDGEVEALRDLLDRSAGKF